ncbi:hypothetical protein SAMN05878482_102673 [Peribacillus simplex]|uniref:Uncharacterized protein n=1 Tax=Peribacillus simplex TaxID=1478 RepID=A0A9X8R844_9BACI|nr:hypothetical protein [Peribacillus simplex]SIQ97389.1 hypothetical protein SAMN05878482_102673 [Peribacillus simplex]
MFNAHTAVVLDTSGTGILFGRIPIEAVRPKTNKSPAHMKKEYGKPAAAHGFPSLMVYSVPKWSLSFILFVRIEETLLALFHY